MSAIRVQPGQLMRVITKRRLSEFWAAPGHRDSRNPLLHWLDDVRLSAWQTPTDVKATFGKRVDFVKTRTSGNTLVVFDIAGNKYRLIAAVHYVQKYPVR